VQTIAPLTNIAIKFIILRLYEPIQPYRFCGSNNSFIAGVEAVLTDIVSYRSGGGKSIPQNGGHLTAQAV
jgi:hypothetical protein